VVQAPGQVQVGRLWCRSQVRLSRVQEKVWEALAQSQVKLNRVPKKVLVKVWAQNRASQVQQGCGEGSGEGLGGFGAEPGQGSGEGSGEGLGGFLVQTQLK